MSAATSIAAGVKAAGQAWKAFCKLATFKRRQIARAELEAENGKGKDLDGDGVVGGVGNTPRTRSAWLRGRGLDRSADAQRAVLDEGGDAH